MTTDEITDEFVSHMHPLSVLVTHVCMLSCFSRVQLLVTLWTVACQAPLSMGFSRKEYWSGLPCPPPGDLPCPGNEPRSPVLQADSTFWATREALPLLGKMCLPSGRNLSLTPSGYSPELSSEAELATDGSQTAQGRVGSGDTRSTQWLRSCPASSPAASLSALRRGARMRDWEPENLRREQSSTITSGLLGTLRNLSGPQCSKVPNTWATYLILNLIWWYYHYFFFFLAMTMSIMWLRYQLKPPWTRLAQTSIPHPMEA